MTLIILVLISIFSTAITGYFAYVAAVVAIFVARLILGFFLGLFIMSGISLFAEWINSRS